MILRRLPVSILLALGTTFPGAALLAADASEWQVVEDYCFKCHNTTDWAGSIEISCSS